MTYFTSAAAHPRPAHRNFAIMRYIDLYRQRRALAALDTARLTDIGLSRQDAEVEAGRAFWDAPVHWK